jgi:hypothetical protein
MSSCGYTVSVKKRHRRPNWTYSNFQVALPKTALFDSHQKPNLYPAVYHRLLSSFILKFTHDDTSVGNFLSSNHITRSVLVEQIMRSWVEIDPHWRVQHKDRGEEEKTNTNQYERFEAGGHPAHQRETKGMRLGSRWKTECCEYTGRSQTWGSLLHRNYNMFSCYFTKLLFHCSWLFQQMSPGLLQWPLSSAAATVECARGRVFSGPGTGGQECVAHLMLIYVHSVILPKWRTCDSL